MRGFDLCIGVCRNRATKAIKHTKLAEYRVGIQVSEHRLGVDVLLAANLQSNLTGFDYVTAIAGVANVKYWLVGSKMYAFQLGYQYALLVSGEAVKWWRKLHVNTSGIGPTRHGIKASSG